MKVRSGSEGVVVRNLSVCLLPLLAVSCAAPTRTSVPPMRSVAENPAVMSTRLVETRYDVRGYREAGSPVIRHEAHAVYRRTLVPMNTEEGETVLRTTFAPASYTPLPASAELNAELAKQKAITADMQEMRAAMATTQAKMQAQFAQLVKQSGEASRLRDRLEAERSQMRANAVAAPDGVAATADPRATQAKW